MLHAVAAATAMTKSVSDTSRERRNREREEGGGAPTHSFVFLLGAHSTTVSPLASSSPYCRSSCSSSSSSVFLLLLLFYSFYSFFCFVFSSGSPHMPNANFFFDTRTCPTAIGRDVRLLHLDYNLTRNNESSNKRSRSLFTRCLLFFPFFLVSFRVLHHRLLLLLLFLKQRVEISNCEPVCNIIKKQLVNKWWLLPWSNSERQTLLVMLAI